MGSKNSAWNMFELADCKAAVFKKQPRSSQQWGLCYTSTIKLSDVTHTLREKLIEIFYWLEAEKYRLTN